MEVIVGARRGAIGRGPMPWATCKADGATTPALERLDRPAARAVGSAVGLQGGV
jgi:hypothetical protein